MSFVNQAALFAILSQRYVNYFQQIEILIDKYMSILCKNGTSLSGLFKKINVH